MPHGGFSIILPHRNLFHIGANVIRRFPGKMADYAFGSNPP
jgi:hypothetical protein